MAYTQDEILIWHDSHIKEVELSVSTLLTHTFPKHFHQTYAFGLSSCGSGVIFCPGKKNTVSQDQMIFLHPGEVHWGAPQKSGPWKYYMLFIEEIAIQKIIGHSNTLTFGSTGIANCKFKKNFCKIFNIFTHSSSILEKETALYFFIKSMIDSDKLVFSNTKKDNHHLKLLRNYICEKFRESFSIEELANKVNLHPNYIFELFNKSLGISPHQYQLQLKINAAKKELAIEKNLANIALDLGFYDQSHFTKVFKRAIGVPPGAYMYASHGLVANNLWLLK